MMAPAENSSPGSGPPAARLTLRVGVTGHRPNRLHGADSELLRGAVRQILELVQRIANDIQLDADRVYDAAGPVCRLVSALAEGADRIVAQEALDLGYELDAVLPFQASAYERDFEDAASLVEFRALLRQARAVLALDGSRQNQEEQDSAYEAAGSAILDHTDLVVAIWDGEEARGTGGTAEIVRAGLERGIPLVRIDSQQPHRSGLLSYDRRLGSIEEAVDGLAARIRPEMLPPEVSESDEKSDPLRTFLAERQPRVAPLGWAWAAFVGLVADLRLRIPRIRVRDFESETAAQWEREWRTAPGLPEPLKHQLDRIPRTAYAWADGLAVYYANAYRSAFVVSYALGVLATVLAIAIDASTWIRAHEVVARLLRAGSFISVLLILVIWFLAHRRRWHDRWIDYRLLAEFLRQMRFLALLGRPPASSTPPAASGEGETRGSWIAWYLRALAREAGFAPVELTPVVLDATRILLREELIGAEIQYHANNARRLGRLDLRLRNAGSLFFVVALVALGALVVGETSWLTALAALLPVFGGAVAAVRSQAELVRVVKRSRAMTQRLGEIAEDLADQGLVLSSTNIARAVESAAQSMIAEVMDWQIVFEEKPLELGG